MKDNSINNPKNDSNLSMLIEPTQVNRMSDDLSKYHSSMRNLEGFELLTHGELVRKCKEFEARIAMLEADSPNLDDFAMLVRRLAHSLKKHHPDSKLPAQAMAYLSRYNLQGSPLRSPTPPQEKG